MSVVDYPVVRRQAPQRYVPFPVSIFPEPLRTFVLKSAKAIGCDESYVALPALTVSASCIGNSRRIQLKRGWTEPAIIWGGIVGESGTLKTPPFRLNLKYIRAIQRQHFEEHGKRVQDYEKDKAKYEADVSKWKRKPIGDPPDKPEEPLASRLVISDTTVEALAPILQANPRGVLLGIDELAGWFSAFDRYMSRGKGDASHWLSMFNAETIIVDRKTGFPRSIMVPLASVSIVGGIQPGILHRALGQEHRESGLAARLLLTMPPRHPKAWTDEDIPPELEAKLAGLLENLLTLQMENSADGLEPGIARMNKGAHRLWIDWYNKHAVQQTELTGELAAAWSKLEGYGARLALVIHYLRWAAGDMAAGDEDIIDETDIETGCALADWFGDEAIRVYSMLGESDEDRRVREMVELVEENGGSISVRELQHHRRKYRGDLTLAEADLGELVELKLARWEHISTGGHPAKRCVLTNGNESPSTVTGNTGNGNTNLPDEVKNEASVTVTSVTTPDWRPSITAPANGNGIADTPRRRVSL